MIVDYCLPSDHFETCLLALITNHSHELIKMNFQMLIVFFKYLGLDIYPRSQVLVFTSRKWESRIGSFKRVDKKFHREMHI